MLTDIFGDLEIEETESKVRGTQCKPEDYVADDHSVGWFLTKKLSKAVKGQDRPDSEREFMFHKGDYYYHHKMYKEAYEEYKSLVNDFHHTHSQLSVVPELDSLIRCATKIPGYTIDDLLTGLEVYKQVVRTDGHEKEYYILEKDIYAQISDEEATTKFIDTAGPNFTIGYITRAVILLERHVKHAHGFVVDVILKKLNTLNDRLKELGYSDDRISEARQQMGADLRAYQGLLSKQEEQHGSTDAMLTAMFNGLEIKETEPQVCEDQSKTKDNAADQNCEPGNNAMVDHRIGWFLNKQLSKVADVKDRTEDERVVMTNKAHYYYYHRRYSEALEGYKTLVNKFHHTRSYPIDHEISSLVRCATKIPSYTVDDLVTGLDVYKQSTRDIHLDYAYLEKDIYAGICDDDASKKFVSIVCLMCEAVDLPEHWLAFGEKPSLIETENEQQVSQKPVTLTIVVVQLDLIFIWWASQEMGPNFTLGYITRAIMLLERQVKLARGFVADVMLKKLEALNKRLNQLGYSDDRINEARQQMGADLRDYKGTLNENDEKLDRYIGRFQRSDLEDFPMKQREYDRAVRHFKRHFRWMFEGCAF
ncbi:unnamed protein product [Heligmosomoides polygyrus]|uniref:TPR_REGION domain-containing protein n=1 Tax=Heligmosomoides polygyrus TaxID=6339 RepID=A0A183FSC3_HELPZ|nr:unnamed protein product [Heligmosomoides polygyrus]